MNFRITLWLILGMLTISHAQDPKSKADNLFYEYAYKEAIRAYQKEQLQRPLTKDQTLNLAEAFYKIGSYESAAKIYMEAVKKDTTVSNYHFNKMLQAFVLNGEIERVNAFLATKNGSFSSEVIDNAAFNYELLEQTATTADFKVFNIMGNSSQADFSPTFYKEKLLFTSGREETSKNIYKPSGESYLELFVARITNEGDVTNPNIFQYVPRTRFHQATPFYAEQEDALYYILSNAEGDELAFDDNGKNALAIGKVDKYGTFQFLLRDLSTSFYYPFYDTESQRLYFAANFEDSYGGTDLYYVNTNSGTIMSAPVNLGPRINTPGNEIAPYVFENSLYFSSDVFYGLGGMDIYKSTIRSANQFSVPANLGAGINSSADDFGFIIRRNEAAGISGYFASNRAGGKGNDDIYGYTLQKTPGLKTLLVKGQVIRPKNAQGLSEVSVKMLASDNSIIREVFTDNNGNYQIEIPWRDAVTIAVSKENYAVKTMSYRGASIENIDDVPLNFELSFVEDVITTKENLPVIRINKFYFSKGSAAITAEIGLELDKVVQAISDFPSLRIQIETHTDSRGNTNTNLRLSQKRAEAIESYLLKNGASPNSIVKAIGYGESRITNNCTNGRYCLEILHKRNDRTLFVISNYDQLF